MSAHDFINLKTYPIGADSPERVALLESVRADLERDGCAVLKGFLTADGVAALTAEAESVSEQGYRSFNRTNAYFTKDDPDLPADHPKTASLLQDVLIITAKRRRRISYAAN